MTKLSTRIIFIVSITGILGLLSFQQGEAFFGRISPPQKIQIQAHPQGILLTWKSPRDKNFSGFRIYRYQKRKGVGVLIAELDPSASSFLDSNIVTDTPYYYIVRTVSNSGKESKNKKYVALRRKASAEMLLLPVPKKTEQNLAEQFAELEKELLGAKTTGKNLAEAHYKRIKKDLGSLESRGYSSTELERLRKLARDLSLPAPAPQTSPTKHQETEPPIAPASTQTPAPSSTPPPSPTSSSPAPTLPPPTSTTPPPVASASPPALNSWVLPFYVGSAYDSVTKSQGEISFAGEWVVRPFGGGRGANTWQSGNNLDMEFELVPGTILRAAVSGKITFFKNPVTTSPDGGTFDPQDWELHIQLGDGTYYIVYDHVIDIRVSNGETVQAGQAIARASPASIRHGGSQGQKLVDELEWGLRRAIGQAMGLCPFDYLTVAEQTKLTSILETMRTLGFGTGEKFCLGQKIPG